MSQMPIEQCDRCGVALEPGQTGLCDDCQLPDTPSRGAFIAAARAQYGKDTIGIDDNAILSEHDTGAWVMAWVDVDNHDAAKHENTEEAREANSTRELLGHSAQQQIITALKYALARLELADEDLYDDKTLPMLRAALQAAGETVPPPAAASVFKPARKRAKRGAKP